MLPYSKSTIFTVGLVIEMSNSEYLFKHGNSIFIIQYLFRRSDKNKELSTCLISVTIFYLFLYTFLKACMCTRENITFISVLVHFKLYHFLY